MLPVLNDSVGGEDASATTTTSSSIVDKEASTATVDEPNKVFFESGELRRICAAVKAYTEAGPREGAGQALREALLLFRGKPMTLDWDLRR